jgi:hypothetical protein
LRSESPQANSRLRSPRRTWTATGNIFSRGIGKKDWLIINATKAGKMLHNSTPGYCAITAPPSRKDEVADKLVLRDPALDGLRHSFIPQFKLGDGNTLSKHCVNSPISDKVTGQQRTLTPRSETQWLKITGESRVMSPRPSSRSPRNVSSPELTITGKVNEVGRSCSPKRSHCSMAMKITDQRRDPLSKAQGVHAPVAGKITNGGL